MTKTDRIYIAGHRGMVGSSLERLFRSEGYRNIITRSSGELDLTNQNEVREFFKKEEPKYVFLAAARVGGIQANISAPAEFLYENLQIQSNVIHQAYLSGVKKLVFFGSSCIYPKNSPQPMKEEYLLTGELEPTNESYAIAKIAGLKLCQYYQRQHQFSCISIMPCNLYGPNDNFDLQNAHVLAALVKRFVDAKNSNSKEITLWGTGSARRELMHVDDLARAVLLLVNEYDKSEFINVGTGQDISIFDLADLVSNLVNFKGEIKWDTNKPDGMLIKCMDVTKIKSMGFTPKIDLVMGINQMIEIYNNLK